MTKDEGVGALSLFLNILAACEGIRLLSRMVRALSRVHSPVSRRRDMVAGGFPEAGVSAFREGAD